jgi:hypothetical protein
MIQELRSGHLTGYAAVGTNRPSACEARRTGSAAQRPDSPTAERFSERVCVLVVQPCPQWPGPPGRPGRVSSHDRVTGGDCVEGRTCCLGAEVLQER